MFRRGDTALVVMAYDARVTKQLAGGKLTAALVVTPGDKPTDYGKIVHDAAETGVLIARAPWGPLLMSAEVYAPDKKAVARARYGIRPPFAVGTRVTLSDLLFYKPYGTFPAPSKRPRRTRSRPSACMANEKLGVFWESYGTDPAGEKMKVSLTVLKEVEEAGFLKRKAESLKLVHEATPVVVSVEDLSARREERHAARARTGYLDAQEGLVHRAAGDRGRGPVHDARGTPDRDHRTMRAIVASRQIG